MRARDEALWRKAREHAPIPLPQTVKKLIGRLVTVTQQNVSESQAAISALEGGKWKQEDGELKAILGYMVK